MPNEITNPGPWEYWPVSGHVVDAAGNTVCTIAPDCSAQAKAIISKAPEALHLLRNLLTNISSILLTDVSPTESEAAILMEEITEASHLLNSLAQ